MKQHMKGIWNRIILGACCASPRQVWAQTPQFATLDIEWENFIVYADDVADPSRLVSSPNNVDVNIRDFILSGGDSRARWNMRRLDHERGVCGRTGSPGCAARPDEQLCRDAEPRRS